MNRAARLKKQVMQPEQYYKLLPVVPVFIGTVLLYSLYVVISCIMYYTVYELPMVKYQPGKYNNL